MHRLQKTEPFFTRTVTSSPFRRTEGVPARVPPAPVPPLWIHRQYQPLIIRLFLVLCFSLFFFFLFHPQPATCVSPFGIPDGLGEDVVSPVQIHDPVLQVEFPFVLTSVDLEERRGTRRK